MRNVDEPMTQDANHQTGIGERPPDRGHDAPRVSSVQPIAPAILLVGVGMALLLIAIFSDQWLKATDTYRPFRVGDSDVIPSGY